MKVGKWESGTYVCTVGGDNWFKKSKKIQYKNKHLIHSRKFYMYK